MQVMLAKTISTSSKQMEVHASSDDYNNFLSIYKRRVHSRANPLQKLVESRVPWPYKKENAQGIQSWSDHRNSWVLTFRWTQFRSREREVIVEHVKAGELEF